MTALRLILANVVIFIILKITWMAAPDSTGHIVDLLALPAPVAEALVTPWSLLTYSMVHLNFMHLLINSLWLAWFGALLERTAGSRFTLLCFAAGTIGGALAFVATGSLMHDHSEMVLIGCSASTFSVMTAALITVPDRKIAIPAFGRFPIKWIAAVGLLLFIAASTGMSPTQTAAHAGGLISGAAAACAWKWRTRRKMELMKTLTRRKMARNQILDKARKSGYASLSRSERIELFNISGAATSAKQTAN